MSTGFSGKGKDGKYNTLNIVPQYKKGRSVDSKSGGSGYRHGFQSLGKVVTTRRVPAPASIPSLKSENLGNDPNINLVPKDGSGWASKSETPPTCTAHSQPSPQQPASSSYSHPATCAATSANANAQNQKWSPSIATQQQSWSSTRGLAGKKVLGVAGGDRGRGTIPSSDDFPTLGGSSVDGNGQKRDSTLALGQNLRPERSFSWKSGGGKAFSQPDGERQPFDAPNAELGVTQSQKLGNSSGRINVDPRYNDNLSKPLLAPNERYSMSQQQQQYSEYPEHMYRSKPDEGNWVAMQPEVDYAEKLNFSDDDSDSHKSGPTSNDVKNSHKEKMDKVPSDLASSPMQAWSSEPAIDSKPYGKPAPESEPTSQRWCDDVDERATSSPHHRHRSPGSAHGWSHEVAGMTPSHHQHQHGARSEREEAVHRARRRREEEELRMERKRRESVKSYTSSYGSASQDRHRGSATTSKPRYDSSSQGRLPGDGYDRLRGGYSGNGGGEMAPPSLHQREHLDSYGSYHSDRQSQSNYDDARYNAPQVMDSNHHNHHQKFVSKNRAQADHHDSSRSTDYSYRRHEFDRSHSRDSAAGSPVKTRDNAPEDNGNSFRSAPFRPPSSHRESSHDVKHTKAYSKSSANYSSNVRIPDSADSKSSARTHQNDDEERGKASQQQLLPARRTVNKQVKLKDFRCDDDKDSDSPESASFPASFERCSSSKINKSDAGEHQAKSASLEKKSWTSVKDAKQSSEDSTTPSATTTSSSSNGKQSSSSTTTQQESVDTESCDGNNDGTTAEDTSLRSAPSSKKEPNPGPQTQPSHAEREDQNGSERRFVPRRQDHRDASYKDHRFKRPEFGGGYPAREQSDHFGGYSEERRPRRQNSNGSGRGGGGGFKSEDHGRSKPPGRSDPGRFETRHNGSQSVSDSRRRDQKKNIPRYPFPAEGDDSTATDSYDQSGPSSLTPAAPPPSTNIWVERAKKQQQKEETCPLTYIPKEEDKKRTLKETAPVKKAGPARNESGSDRRRPSGGHGPSFRKEDKRMGAAGKFDNGDGDEKMMSVGGRRNESPQSTTSSSANFQNSRRETSQHSFDPNDRRRGRGRSRGGFPPGNNNSSRGGGYPSTSTNQAPRGRGRRGARYTSPYNNSSRGNVPSEGGRSNEHFKPPRSMPRANKGAEGKGENADKVSENKESAATVNRRRHPSENSETGFSNFSHSDVDNDDSSKLPSRRNVRNRGGGGKRAPPNTDNSNNTSQPSSRNDGAANKPNNSSRGKTSFTARGAPSRRGRGGVRGGKTRGGGSRTSDPTATAAVSPSSRSSNRNDKPDPSTSRNPRNAGRATTGGSEPSHNDNNRNDGRNSDRNSRKKRGHPERPPRFNKDADSQNSSRKGSGANSGRRPSHEGWDSNSEHSLEAKKPPARGGDQRNKNSSNSRGGSSNRRAGGRGNQHGASKRNTNANQVYMIHSVKYNDPSAIAGAIAASTNSPNSNANLEAEQQERSRDLFQKYDLHNYARVVNVDDIPEVSGQKDSQSGDEGGDKGKDALQCSGDAVNGGGCIEDDDGFTPVLSKRQQKKLQEEKKKETLLKQEQSQAVTEALKKAQRNKSKNSSKSSNAATTNALNCGASGGVRHASAVDPTTDKHLSKEIWNSNVAASWEKKTDSESRGAKAEKDGDKSSRKGGAASQHDSGVDSSIPSSRRSSPGTDAKLTNFNQLANTASLATVPDQKVNDSVGDSNIVVSSIAKSLKISDDSCETADQGVTTSKQQTIGSNKLSAFTDANLHSPSIETEIESFFPPLDDPDTISFIAESSGNSKNFSKEDEKGNPPPTPVSSAAAASSQNAQVSFTDETPSLFIGESFMTITQSVLRRDFSVAEGGKSKDVREGVKQTTETSKNMSLNPQAQSNQTAAAHKNVVDTASIAPPMPLTPKLPSSESPGAEGDHTEGKTGGGGIRQSCDSVSNGSGDMGHGVMATPTSPTVDMEVKMESARKAWENTQEATMAPAGKSAGGKSDGYFHPSSTAMSSNIGSESGITSLTDASLKEGQSGEWQTSCSNNTPSSMQEKEGSWREGSQQQQQQNVAPQCVSTSSMPVQQSDSVKESSQVSSTNKIQEVPIQADQFVGSSVGNDSMETTNQHLMSHPYDGGCMFVVDHQNSQFIPQRVPVQQTQQATIYQPISSSTLASNLHPMQQQTFPPNPPYNNTMGMQPTQPGYNSQTREFTPMMVSHNAMSNPSIDLGQQTSINSQWPMHRPHNGGAPSPHATVLIPVVEQNRQLMPSQPNAAANLINQQMNRSQSTPYYNQPGSVNYFGQQQQPQQQQQQQTASHIPSQNFPPPPLPFQHSRNYLSTLKNPAMSSLGLENMTLSGGPTPANPIHQNSMYIHNQAKMRVDPPQTADYSQPQQQQQFGSFYAKHPPVMMGKSAMSSVQHQQQSAAQQAAAGYDQQQQMKHGMVGAYNSNPTGGGGGVKFAPNPAAYQMPKSSDQQANHFGKYDVHQQQPKSFMPHGVMGSDWNKQSGSNQQQRLNNHPSTLARSYLSCNDTSMQQQQQPSMKTGFKDPMSSYSSNSSSYLHQQPPPQQQQQQRYDGNSWNSSKPNMHHSAMGGASNQISLLGKPPVRSMMSNSSRFPIPGLQHMQSANLNSVYQNKPSALNPRMQHPPMNPYMPVDKSRQSPAMPSAQFASNQMKKQQANQNNKSSGNRGISGGGGGSKAPPVPTLVRQSGSSLVGKKPTHLPEEVVKSNQANERASLLQSLSAFMTDKNSSKPDAAVCGEGSGGAGGKTDWSTKVANSSPLPQRKPGNRHPGVEKYKDELAKRRGSDGSGGCGGNGRNKRPGRGGRKCASGGPDAADKPINNNGQQQQQNAAKKLTLADTKPKKGEVSKINMGRGEAAPFGGGGVPVPQVKPNGGPGSE